MIAGSCLEVRLRSVREECLLVMWRKLNIGKGRKERRGKGARCYLFAVSDTKSSIQMSFADLQDQSA